MAYLETKEQKISAGLSVFLILLLIALFRFVSVLNIIEPPEESGIAVNFGNTDVGSGNNFEPNPTKVTPPAQPEPVEPTDPAPVDNVATQDNTDAPVIESDPDVQTPVEKPVDKPVEKPVEPKPKPKPKPSNSVLDALSNVEGAEAVDGENNEGEGPGDGPGNKGQLNGNPYANTYYGNPGTGQGGKGYGLSGRGKVAGSGVKPDCFETGKVIVEIHVNRKGEVVKADPGKKGSTNKANCLLEAAAESAKTYKFTPAPQANPIQIGFIEVIFKVGE
jgi:outer membrane biosynthesis protein TonB